MQLRLSPTRARIYGRIVKTTGDGLLLEFPSVVDAVRCAVSVRRGMAERTCVPYSRRERSQGSHPKEDQMRYWWVNQNQTYAHEIGGGYLWSPKRNKNGGRNKFYDNMQEVSPGDVVFSFCDTLIKAVGIAQGKARSAGKPTAFGDAGANWGNEGWPGLSNECRFEQALPRFLRFPRSRLCFRRRFLKSEA